MEVVVVGGPHEERVREIERGGVSEDWAAVVCYEKKPCWRELSVSGEEEAKPREREVLREM